ncbi:MAG: MurR/RpiR family transcriptional regulator [bacterium]
MTKAQAHLPDPDNPEPTGDVAGDGTRGTLDRIRVARPELRGALSACATYVADNPWQVRGQSIKEVATGAGVSTNAVHRFTRAIGYDGFRSFVQALSLDLGRVIGSAYGLPSSLVSPSVAAIGSDNASVSAQSVIARVFELEIEALADTMRNIPRSIERVVDALVGANEILFVGTGAAMALCELSAYRLMTLGIHSSAASDPGAILPRIFLMKPGDVVFAVSYHGNTRHVNEALEDGRSRGLTTVCLTAVSGSVAGSLADHELMVIGPRTAIAFGQFASRVASATMLDALAAAVAWRLEATALPHANALQTALRSRTFETRRHGTRQPREA